MYLLNDLKFNIHTQHVIGDTQYPAGWFEIPEHRLMVGVIEVPDPIRPDDLLFIVSENPDGTWNSTPHDIATSKASLKARVSTERKRRELGGATIGGRVIPTDMETRALIQELTERVRDGAASVNFQRGDGTWATLTAAQFTALARAVRTHVNACRMNERAHHDAIDALTSPAAAAAYDTTTGWPA